MRSNRGAGLSSTPRRSPGATLFGGAADVDGALRGEHGERRRPLLRQPAVDVVLDHDQVVPAASATIASRRASDMVAVVGLCTVGLTIS